jgi:hypothetical protein
VSVTEAGSPAHGAVPAHTAGEADATLLATRAGSLETLRARAVA